MNKLLVMIGLMVSLNCSASMITCYVGTPNEFTVNGKIVMADKQIYRIEGDDLSIHYVPANECVVAGPVFTPTYNVMIERN